MSMVWMVSPSPDAMLTHQLLQLLLLLVLLVDTRPRFHLSCLATNTRTCCLVYWGFLVYSKLLISKSYFCLIWLLCFGIIQQQSMGQGSRNLGSRLYVWPMASTFLQFKFTTMLISLLLLPLLSFSLHTHRHTGRRTGSARSCMRARAAHSTNNIQQGCRRLLCKMYQNIPNSL